MTAKRVKLVQPLNADILGEIIPYLPFRDLTDESIRKNLFPLLDIDGDGSFSQFQSPRVNLSGTYITEETLRTLLHHNKHIRELCIRNCHKIYEFSCDLPHLEYFNISFANFSGTIPNLKTLISPITPFNFMH